MKKTFYHLSLLTSASLLLFAAFWAPEGVVAEQELEEEMSLMSQEEDRAGDKESGKKVILRSTLSPELGTSKRAAIKTDGGDKSVIFGTLDQSKPDAKILPKILPPSNSTEVGLSPTIRGEGSGVSVQSNLLRNQEGVHVDFLPSPQREQATTRHVRPEQAARIEAQRAPKERLKAQQEKQKEQSIIKRALEKAGKEVSRQSLVLPQSSSDGQGHQKEMGKKITPAPLVQPSHTPQPAAASTSRGSSSTPKPGSTTPPPVSSSAGGGSSSSPTPSSTTPPPASSLAGGGSSSSPTPSSTTSSTPKPSSTTPPPASSSAGGASKLDSFEPDYTKNNLKIAEDSDRDYDTLKANVMKNYNTSLVDKKADFTIAPADSSSSKASPRKIKGKKPKAKKTTTTPTYAKDQFSDPSEKDKVGLVSAALYYKQALDKAKTMKSHYQKQHQFIGKVLSDWEKSSWKANLGKKDQPPLEVQTLQTIYTSADNLVTERRNLHKNLENVRTTFGKLDKSTHGDVTHQQVLHTLRNLHGYLLNDRLEHSQINSHLAELEAHIQALEAAHGSANIHVKSLKTYHTAISHAATSHENLHTAHLGSH